MYSGSQHDYLPVGEIADLDLLICSVSLVVEDFSAEERVAE